MTKFDDITSTFEWMLDHIRIEKIISASILPPNFFLDVLVVLPVRQLQSWAILGKNDVKP